MAGIILFAGVAGSHLGAVSNCDFDKSGAKLVKETKLKDGTVKLGTLQISKKDQNPIVAFFQNGRQVFCRRDIDTSPVDARAVAATGDKEHLFVAFSTDGGANHREAFTRFTQAGWMKFYGNGGGAKVLVILKLRKTDGEVVGGTYLTARKADGKTNSVALKKLVFENNALQVHADTWYSPLKHDQTPYNCTGPSPFFYTVQFAPELTNVMSTNAGTCE